MNNPLRLFPGLCKVEGLPTHSDIHTARRHMCVCVGLCLGWFRCWRWGFWDSDIGTLWLCYWFPEKVCVKYLNLHRKSKNTHYRRDLGEVAPDSASNAQKSHSRRRHPIISLTALLSEYVRHPDTARGHSKYSCVCRVFCCCSTLACNPSCRV